MNTEHSSCSAPAASNCAWYWNLNRNCSGQRSPAPRTDGDGSPSPSSRRAADDCSSCSTSTAARGACDGAALLQQQLAGLVEDQQRESPVQHPRAAVAPGLAEMSDLAVGLVHQDERLGIRGTLAFIRAM